MVCLFYFWPYGNSVAPLPNGRNVYSCRFNALYKAKNVHAHYAAVLAQP